MADQSIGPLFDSRPVSWIYLWDERVTAWLESPWPIGSPESLALSRSARLALRGLPDA